MGENKVRLTFVFEKNVLPLHPFNGFIAFPSKTLKVRRRMTKEAVTLVNGRFSRLREDEIQGDGATAPIASLRQSTDGVSPNYVPMYEGNRLGDGLQWFLMRASYGQEKKAVEYLTGKSGIGEVFCPQWLQERKFGGKRKKILVSILPNTLFVKSTRTVLRRYIGTPPLTFFHHYYQTHKDDKGRNIENGRTPIVIPDRQMLSFQKWLDADVEDKIYMNETFKFKKNDLVRVKDGDFEGFVGHVVRLKGQTRVGINIEGVGFISTAYIPKNCLEIINQ